VSPRALEEIVRPRLQSGASGRPLNSSVRSPLSPERQREPGSAFARRPMNTDLRLLRLLRVTPGGARTAGAVPLMMRPEILRSVASFDTAARACEVARSETMSSSLAAAPPRAHSQAVYGLLTIVGGDRDAR
jgi:hypothetical protein